MHGDRSEAQTHHYSSQLQGSGGWARPASTLHLALSHLPLVGQVRLVAHQHDDNIAAPLCPDIVDPLRGLLEGVEIWKWKVGRQQSESQPEQVEGKGGREHETRSRREGDCASSHPDQ